MGFGSGVQIFDDVMKVIFENDLPESKEKEIIKGLITALEDHDWDTQRDSEYYDYPQVQEAFMELHPE